MRRSALLPVLLVSFPVLSMAAPLDGTITGAQGTPLPQTTIALKDGQGKIAQKTQSDAQGHYRFDDVSAGSYVLQALDHDKILGSSVVSIAQTQTHQDLNLSEDQSFKVVIAQKRDHARNSLSPSTGTSAYKMDTQTIAALPQGEDTAVNKMLLQAPGVAQDSAASGGLHIRGEHANAQYRLNGILLPDGISGFGDTLDSHFIDNVTLLDGALPAQYGFRTAGVIDITTKNGFHDGGTASMTAGSNGTFQPSISYGGTIGASDYFVAASHLSSDLGIENPTKNANALHDHTEQNKQFGYMSSMIDPMQRIEAIAGNAISYFQIPNNPGQDTAGYQLNGATSASSSALNERQFESNQYMAVAWQGGADGLEMQIAPYIRKSETHYRPDVFGDLMFNGVASEVRNTDLATGLQNDNSWRIDSAHTLRAEMSAQNDSVKNNSTSYAFLTDAGGTPLSDGNGNNIVSSPIVNNHAKDGQLYGLYVQDEWKLNDQLTLNYGARFDAMEQYVSASQLSPRVGLVYKASDATTLHAGYARTFTPPPIELVSSADIAGFANTTNAAVVTQNDAVQPERSHSFDIGATHKLDDHWQVGLDGYYKLVRDMLDEGQFGQAMILTPFNYDRGHIYGSELSLTYSGDKLKAYGNLAYSRAMGTKIVSGQYNFTDADELAYINSHYVHLDHDQTLTASAGASYEVIDGTTLGLDSLFGSGMRKDFANTKSLPAYATFNASVEQKFSLFPKDETSLRLSVVNLLDASYQLRDGTGIGVGAPQWGARRGAFVTVAQKF